MNTDDYNQIEVNKSIIEGSKFLKEGFCCYYNN